MSGVTAFVGDVHLDVGEPEVDEFVAFLDRLAERATRIVLLGDLFNLWIGSLDLEQEHQRAVADKLGELRRRGTAVRYLEGNRDYRIGPCYAGSAFDDATEDGLVEEIGGRSLFAIHGDLANAADRQYRTWRRVSRSAPVWGLFELLPSGMRRRLVDELERRMRGSNLEFKREFPEAEVRDYADGFFAAGHDAVILGHFHVEKDLDAGGGKRILVLPEWKGNRRHLEAREDGTLAIVPSS